MNRIITIFIACAWIFCAVAEDQPADTTYVSDSLAVVSPDTYLADESPNPANKAHPWRALGELAFICTANNSVARFAMKEEYANSTMHSIRDNLKSGFSWDDDNFYLNYLGHCYQGSAYFNTARTNGLNFWQSVPYSVLGSLTWEIACENDPPSINDMIVTPVCGVLWGEIAHRLVPAIVDEREKGPKRFFREVAATIVNPVEGVLRLVNGRMWKVNGYKYATIDGVPTHEEPDAQFSLAVGTRMLAPAHNFSSNKYQPYISFAMRYGQTADGESHSSIYDYFTVEGTAAFGTRQNFFSSLNITGRICSMPAIAKENVKGELGIYQFFHYEDTHISADSIQSPFPFGEMASFGPGIIFSLTHLAPRVSLEQAVYARGVLLGAANSDYYKYHNRTYNMGSGYGATSSSRLTWQDVGNMQLTAYFMHLFTWKGYEHKATSVKDIDTVHLSAQGDRSNARLLLLNLQGNVNLSQQLGIGVGASYYSRHTKYKYHPNQHAESCELRAGLVWRF